MGTTGPGLPRLHMGPAKCDCGDNAIIFHSFRQESANRPALYIWVRIAIPSAYRPDDRDALVWILMEDARTKVVPKYEGTVQGMKLS